MESKNYLEFLKGVHKTGRQPQRITVNDISFEIPKDYVFSFDKSKNGNRFFVAMKDSVAFDLSDLFGCEGDVISISVDNDIFVYDEIANLQNEDMKLEIIEKVNENIKHFNDLVDMYNLPTKKVDGFTEYKSDENLNIKYFQMPPLSGKIGFTILLYTIYNGVNFGYGIDEKENISLDGFNNFLNSIQIVSDYLPGKKLSNYEEDLLSVASEIKSKSKNAAVKAREENWDSIEELRKQIADGKEADEEAMKQLSQNIKRSIMKGLLGDDYECSDEQVEPDDEAVTLETFLEIILSHVKLFSDIKFDNKLTAEINEDPFSACFLSGVAVYIMLKVDEMQKNGTKIVDPELIEILKFSMDTNFWQKHLEMKIQPFSFITVVIYSKVVIGENFDPDCYDFIYQLACNFVGASNADSLDSALKNCSENYPQYKDIFAKIARLVLGEIKKSKTVKCPNVDLRTDLT